MLKAIKRKSNCDSLLQGLNYLIFFLLSLSPPTTPHPPPPPITLFLSAFWGEVSYIEQK